MAEFLLGARFDDAGTVGGTDASIAAAPLCVGASDGVPSGLIPEAPLALVVCATSPPRTLDCCPLSAVLHRLSAKYLHARAALLCGAYAESAVQLRDLLNHERALRPLLRTLGCGARRCSNPNPRMGQRHARAAARWRCSRPWRLAAFGCLAGEVGLLRQLGLAMLHSGEGHAWIELLRERGALGWPELAELVADAWLCEYEPAQAIAVMPPPAPPPLPPPHHQPMPQADAETRRPMLRARNNRACLLVCMDDFAAAERELLECVRLAPTEIAPAYNLALLRWQVGAKTAAADGWLRFRRWPLAATPDLYERHAVNVRPSEGPTASDSSVTGGVDAASAAALDRAMLRYWGARRSQLALDLHWGRAAGAVGTSVGDAVPELRSSVPTPSGAPPQT